MNYGVFGLLQNLSLNESNFEGKPERENPNRTISTND